MKLRKKEDKDRKSSTNAYSRKGRVRKKLYTNACDNNKKEEEKKKKKKRKKKEQTTNACGKERKTKPQMLVANEKWLP